MVNVEVIALICGQKKVNLYLVKFSQKSVSKQLQFFKLDRFTQINFALSCCQVEHASHLSKT